MPHLSSPAILIRAVEHGDFDKIVTLFTLNRGKTSAIAKGAKKSAKRFSGVLELFSLLNVVWSYGRGGGLPVLTEASVVKPLDRIRTNITGTAYASYWCELVYLWMEEGQKQDAVYELLAYALQGLDSGGMSEEVLHILFQLRFMTINGYSPDFARCNSCGTPLDDFQRSALTFDIRRGGVTCEACSSRTGSGSVRFSKGTAKLLGWARTGSLAKVERLRFSKEALDESLRMLEAFVPYHLGKEAKSLNFLKQLRSRPGIEKST